MSELDKLLREYASHPTPPPPSNLRTVFGRDSDPAQSARTESPFDWLAACVWRAHVASASIFAAVALGVGMAWLDPNASAAQPVSHPLNLHVFSEHSPTLPLTNLHW
jgi:anti-sigma-K factor RskA